MPQYVYRCPECGAEREEVHSIKKDPEIRCTCEGVADGSTQYGPLMKRVPQRFGFRTPGPGFYDTGRV